MGVVRVPSYLLLLAALVGGYGCSSSHGQTTPVGYTIKAAPPPQSVPDMPVPEPVAVAAISPAPVPESAPVVVESLTLPATSPPAHEGTRIALLVPLSGSNANLGTALSNAAQLALFDTADAQTELLPLDTKGTPEGAAAALDQALVQGADIILGPVFSAEVKAIAPVAQAHNIPVLAFTTDKAVLGNGVFTMGFLPDVQVKTVITQALTDGRKRLGILAPDTELGHVMADAAQDQMQRLGGEVVKVRFYPPASTDLRAVAQSFADYGHRKVEMAHDKDLLSGRKGSAAPYVPAAMPFDAVFMPDEGVRLKNLASLLTFYGLDPGPVKFLGTFRWDDPSLGQEPTLEGSWFAALPEGSLAAFQAHYVKSFGALPKNLVSFAGGAYDGVALVALLAHKGKGSLTLTNLTDAQGFAGVDGLFRLLPDGTADRGLAVRELIKGGSREAVAAPEHF